MPLITAEVEEDEILSSNLSLLLHHICDSPLINDFNVRYYSKRLKCRVWFTENSFFLTKNTNACQVICMKSS